MSGIVGVSTNRELTVGRAVSSALRVSRAAVVSYLLAVRRRGGLAVTHAVPVAVVITAGISWAIIAVASAARPA